MVPVSLLSRFSMQDRVVGCVDAVDSRVNEET